MQGPLFEFLKLHLKFCFQSFYRTCLTRSSRYFIWRSTNFLGLLIYYQYPCEDDVPIWATNPLNYVVGGAHNDYGRDYFDADVAAADGCDLRF